MKDELKIIEITGYRDGGTTSIKTNLGEYCIGGRAMSDKDDNDIKNPAEGMLYFEHPSKGKQVNLADAKLIKSRLKKALKIFMEKNHVHASRIEEINNIKIK